MPNEQIKVPLYAASEILTASNMNISAGTGVPVFATTVTRDAAFGGAGEKVLAEGQLCYLSSTNVVQYYDGAAWATVGPASAGALVRVGGGSLSGAATTFSSVFSATYDAYQINLSNLVGSTTLSLLLTLGSTITSYYGGFVGVGNDGTVSGYGLSNGTSINRGIYATTNGGGAIVNVINPFLTSRTFFNVSSRNTNTAGGADGANGNGFVDNATSYTAFTITTSSGTCTGTCNIYGFSLS